MYQELLLFPDRRRDDYIEHGEARRIVAAAMDGMPIDPVLFNRDAAGRALQRHHRPDGAEGPAVKRHDDGDRGDREGEGFGDAPSVAIDGGKGFIRLVGVGTEGVDLLDRNAAEIATAVSRQIGGAYTFRTMGGAHRLRADNPTSYAIKHLCLTKKPPEVERWLGTSRGEKWTIDNAAALIRRRIYGGLVSMARLLDRGGTNFERDIPPADSFDLHLFEGRIVWAPFKQGKGRPAHALFASNLRFGLDLRLEGPWYAGLLRSHGYGRLRILGERTVSRSQEAA